MKTFWLFIISAAIARGQIGAGGGVSTYPAIGGGGSSSVNVNGSPVSNPNFNGTTPAAGAGNTNVIFQVSGSSVSGYLSNFVPGAGALTGPGTAQTLPASLTSGGVVCNTSTSQMASSVLIAANALMIGGGAGACPTGTTAIPNGTTATTQSAGDNSTKLQTTAGAMTAANYQGAVNAIGTVTTTQTIACTGGGVQSLALTASTALTITMTQPSSTTCLVRLEITQAAGGSGTVTITGAKWPGGIAPIMTAGASALDVWSCLLDGTNTLCTVGQNFQ